MDSKIVIEGATILTMDAQDRVLMGDLFVENDHIVDITTPGSRPIEPSALRIDARGCFVIPGLIQAHIHLAQVLFRGIAEDRPLLRWLTERILPLEAAHTHESVNVSARLGIAELLLSGTTAALDMGTVNHTDALFGAARDTGLRLTSGKAMMDLGEGVPEALMETAEQSVASSVALAEKWHGNEYGRLRYAFAPRFILSCSEALMRGAVKEARRLGCRLHTHASENPDEVVAVEKLTGFANILELHRLGFTGPDVMLAHCVHLSDIEVDTLARTKTHVAHCPSTNLKLASGIADVPRLIGAGINVGIGGDGTPCNNRIDAFTEMHLASLLQKPRYGAAAMPARDVLRMATMGGAKLLGIDDEVGSLEVGKKADVVVIDGRKPHLRPSADAATTIVHACRGSDVRDVLVEGRLLVREGQLVGVNVPGLLDEAEKQIAGVKKRAGL